MVTNEEQTGSVSVVEVLKQLLEMDGEFEEVDISEIFNDTYHEALNALRDGGFITIIDEKVTQKDIIENQVLGLITAIEFATESTKCEIDPGYRVITMEFDEDLALMPASCIMFSLFYSGTVKRSGLADDGQFTLEICCPKNCTSAAKEMAQILAIMYADIWYDITVYSYQNREKIIN